MCGLVIDIDQKCTKAQQIDYLNFHALDNSFHHSVLPVSSSVLLQESTMQNALRLIRISTYLLDLPIGKRNRE